MHHALFGACWLCHDLPWVLKSITLILLFHIIIMMACYEFAGASETQRSQASTSWCCSTSEVKAFGKFLRHMHACVVVPSAGM